MTAALRIALLCLLLACGQTSAAEPGGRGILRSAVGVECFDTQSAAVPQVCGTFEVHWRLSALMGEPVGRFGLVWKLTAVQLRNGNDEGRRHYAIGALPPALVAAAQRSELMLEGLAYVQGTRQGRLAVAFDTGAPTRPDAKESFNVPGSPDWDQFLIRGSQTGQSLAGWCVPKQRLYAPPAQAKAVMRAGVQLDQLQLCPSSSASADSLAGAIASYCKTGAEAPYCASAPPQTAAATPASDRPANQSQLDKPTPHTAVRQGGAGVADALDEVHDRSSIARQRDTLVATFQRTAQAACTRELAPVQACVQQACPTVPGPSEARCQEIPNRPARRLGPVLTANASGPCDANCERNRRAARERQSREDEKADAELARRVQDWDERWATVAQQCRASRQARVEHAQCSKVAQRQCNPAGNTVQRCLDKRMTQAPTEADARAAFEQQQRQRAQPGERPPFLD
jgi:hypothetical protein